MQFDDRVGSEVMVVLAETDSSAVIDEDSIRQSIVQILQSELDIVPQHIELMTAGELIKTSSGKISRSENSRRYSQRLAAKDHGDTVGRLKRHHRTHYSQSGSGLGFFGTCQNHAEH